MRASGARHGLGRVQSRLLPHLRHTTSTRRRIGSTTPTLDCSKGTSSDAPLLSIRHSSPSPDSVEQHRLRLLRVGHPAVCCARTEDCARPIDGRSVLNWFSRLDGHMGTGHSGVRRKAAHTQLQSSTVRPGTSSAVFKASDASAHS